MNNKYLLKLWLPAALIWLVLLIIFFNSGKEDYQTTLLPVIVAVIGFVLLKAFIGNRIKQHFKKPSAESVLNFYDKTFKSARIPESEFFKAQAKSIALSLYGEFDEGILMVSQFDMTQKAPLYQAAQIIAIVINNYLQKANLPEALTLAKKAKELAKISKIAPGSKTSEKTYTTYVEIGEILNNNLNNEIIKHLEQGFLNSTFILKIQIAWALGIVYTKTNNLTNKKEMLDFLTKNAPYCKPLFNFE